MGIPLWAIAGGINEGVQAFDQQRRAIDEKNRLLARQAEEDRYTQLTREMAVTDKAQEMMDQGITDATGAYEMLKQVPGYKEQAQTRTKTIHTPKGDVHAPLTSGNPFDVYEAKHKLMTTKDGAIFDTVDKKVVYQPKEKQVSRRVISKVDNGNTITVEYSDGEIKTYPVYARPRSAGSGSGGSTGSYSPVYDDEGNLLSFDRHTGTTSETGVHARDPKPDPNEASDRRIDEAKIKQLQAPGLARKLVSNSSNKWTQDSPEFKKAVRDKQAEINQEIAALNKRKASYNGRRLPGKNRISPQGGALAPKQESLRDLMKNAGLL